MRIIDNLGRYDYYDCVQKHVTKTDLTYIRTEEVILGAEAKSVANSLPFRLRVFNQNFKEIIIGFCGKIYRCFDNFSKIIYDEDELYEHYISNKYNIYKSPKAHFSASFTSFKSRENSCRHIFEKYLCPIWTIDNYGFYREDEYRFIKNPILKKLDFYKVFDTYSAYQEISMFLGSLAFPEKEIPKISDKDLAFAKGFDKFSFRKDGKK